MTFIFNSDTIANDTLTFSIPNGPEFAYLQLWSGAANQQLKGDVVNKVNAWANESYEGLVLQRVTSTSRYTEYRFLYSQPGGLDDFDIVFTKDVAGIYNWKLISFVDDFLWNLNSTEWQLETKVWNFSSVLNATVLDTGLISITNVIPYTPPARVTYTSPNENASGYVYLTNNSI
jgi:hypothetical protein